MELKVQVFISSRCFLSFWVSPISISCVCCLQCHSPHCEGSGSLLSILIYVRGLWVLPARSKISIELHSCFRSSDKSKFNIYLTRLCFWSPPAPVKTSVSCYCFRPNRPELNAAILEIFYFFFFTPNYLIRVCDCPCVVAHVAYICVGFVEFVLFKRHFIEPPILGWSLIEYDPWLTQGPSTHRAKESPPCSHCGGTRRVQSNLRFISEIKQAACLVPIKWLSVSLLTLGSDVKSDKQ